MADKEFKLGVEVTDAGTIKAVEEAVKKLRAELQGAAADSKKLSGVLKGVDKAKEGGTAGSRAAADSAGIGIGGYGKQRGVAGETGAAARDFANQAQGLSGLVRLYAVYAANVFAVGMAFRSLSEAMDTTNMIKGLDQLGAASGRNLGGLSKKVMELTGNSISLREAMQAVAQTSSGGMSTRNIERLAAVARSASAALGVAMPDAISRLSRGITKLEPELLDELGIMTRLEPATQAYARELGKAVSQLTDFERRQAFANAVLAEGEAKFGAITEISSNPYDKLISSLKNITQVGATAINTVLAPIVELLSNSPNALTAAIGVMATMIVKQAIPAIGQVKEGLAASATAAAELAKRRAGDALNATMELNNLVAAEAEKRSKVEIDSSVEALEKLTELRGRRIKETSAAFKILEKDIKDISEAELARVDSKADRLFRKGLTEQAALYREITTSVRAQIEAEKERVAALAKNEAIIRKEFTGSKTSIAGITQALAVEANNAAVKKAIISNAAYNAGLVGIARAHTLMNAEIAKSGLALSGFQLAVLKTQATVAGLTAVVSTLGTALIRLTNLFAWIGIVTVLFSTLNGFLTSNAKEAAAAAAASDEFKASSENLSRTLEQLNRQMTQGTIQGLNALAGAYENFAESFAKTVAAIKKEKNAISGIWSTLGNKLAQVVGSDVDSRLAKAMEMVIIDSLELLDSTGLKELARNKFSEILGVSILNSANIKKAMSGLTISMQEDIEKTAANFSLALSNSASKVQSFKVATDASTRAYQQFIQTATNTSPIFKVGAALQNLGVSMSVIGENAEMGASEINAAIQLMVDAPDIASIFGKEFVTQLVKMREEFSKQNVAIGIYKKNLLDLDKQILKTEAARARSMGERANKESTLEKLKSEKTQITNAIGLLTEEQSARARVLFVDGVTKAFAKGAQLIDVSLGQMAAKAANLVQKASLAGLSGENRAKVENQVAVKELEIQLRAIDTNIDLVLSNELLKAAIDKSSAEIAHLAAIQSNKSQAEIDALSNARDTANIFYDLLDKGIVPNLENALKKAGSDLIAQQVAIKGVAPSQKIAEQNEARVFVKGQMDAQGITGAINIRSGRLEDDQRRLALESQLTAATQARANAVQQIVTVSNVALTQQQTELERAILINKQESELAAINTTIANAQSDNEVSKQEGFKQLILAKQAQELEVFALSTAQKVLVARNEMLVRNYELIKATNAQEFIAGQNNVEVLTTELNAYTQLYGIVAQYGASQLEILGTQKAQLDFVKAISEAQLDFSAKELKAKEQLAALSPTQDADRIAAINDELSRQEALTKTTIANAKSNLLAQEKILAANKKATIQQSVYNRVLDNSTSIAESLSTAFGDVGDSIGNMATAFAKMVVNADKGAKAIDLLRQKQIEAGSDVAEVARLEDDITLQRQKNTQMQLAGYASLTTSAKNMFDEQSDGYRTLAAVEKIMFLAHIAFTLKQMAVDVMATTAAAANSATRIAGTVAEAEVSGVAAVLKSLTGLPPPASFVVAGVMAAVVGALLASIGGSSGGAPSIPSGTGADDIQATQGTGRRYLNGKLSDISGGALGSEADKVNDIANSIELIQSNTAITSSYGLDSLNALKTIESNTRSLAAEVFKTTDIGKLGSAFGTVERTAKAPGTGLLSSLIPSSSKAVEIIDKGIKVVGAFSDIMTGAADFLEYEKVQTTKTKSGFLGIGGKTKVKVTTNTKELSQQAEEVVISLFSSLATTSVAASKKLLGEANNSIQEVLDNFIVDFNVSGQGLSGEDFAAAIASESSVIMSQIIEKAMPELSKFRKLGEGFSGTLVRMATTVNTIEEKFAMFGSNIDSSEIIAKLDSFDALVNSLGGIEAFAEKADFLFENFFSGIEQTEFKTKLLGKALKDYTDQGVLTVDQFNTLTDGMGDVKEEYKQIILAQDTFSESGRKAINILTLLAPAVVEFSDSVKEMLDEFNLGVSSFEDIIKDAILGRLEATEIGETIASTIKEGFYSAMSAKFVEETTSLIVNQLITPVLTGVVNLSAITATAASGMINSIVQEIESKADILASLLNNPTFKRALASITTAISQSVIKISNNAKELDFTFSSSKLKGYLEELADLSKEITTNSLDDVLRGEETRLELLQKQAQALKDSSEMIRGFNLSLIDFKQALLTGPQSPLTPLEQYDTAKVQLEDLFLKASVSTSQEEKSAALSKIQEISSTFLDVSRLVYASGSQYTNDFNYVQTILDSLINTTGTQATIEEQQLEAINQQILTSQGIIESINAQLDAVNNTANSTAGILARIEELNMLISKEYKNARDSVAMSFSALDENLNGKLTFEELKAAGIADDATLHKIVNSLDTNGDSQVSYLESLVGASNDIVFSIETMTPILEAINSGVIDVGTGIQLLSEINAANVSKGGSAITDSYTPISGSGTGLINGTVAYTNSLGGYIQNGIVHGVNGESVSLSFAKSTLESYASKVEAGEMTARDVYNVLQDWGVNSSMVGQILSISKKSVLDWFKSYDPTIPAFSKGINFVPEDMLAQIHKGERVFPAADNRMLMQNINANNTTNEELLKEIQQLNLRIAQLEKAVIDGSVINAMATDRNTAEITKTVKETTSINNHVQTIRRTTEIS